MGDDQHNPLTDPVTRRTALRSGVVGVLTLGAGGLLDACGSSSSSSVATTDTTSVAPRRGGTIKAVFGDASSTDTPDPTTAFSYCTLVYSGLCFDSLIALDNSWNASPMLAEEWTVSPDFRRYRFKLRSGVEFHTGKPLTARDVVFSFQRIFDKKVASAGLSSFQGILAPSGVKAVDPMTVQFDLLVPDAYFLIKAGHWYGKIVQAGTSDFSPSKGSFGSGAFKVVSFAGGTGFEVVRNPNYWISGKPYLDRISAAVVPQAATRAQAVLTGDAHLSDPPSFPTLPQFSSSTTASLLASPFGPATDWGIDTSTPPFNNADFRRASKMALDRHAFVNVVARGFGTAGADSIVNPNESYYPAAVQPFPYDPEQAKALLKRSGQPTSGYTIWTTPGLRALGDGSVLLQQQWRAIGLNVNVVDVSYDELINKLFLNRKMVANYWIREHFSTILPLTYTSTAAYNESHIKDRRIDALMAQLSRTPLDKGGDQLLAEILTRYQGAAATVFPFHMKDVWAYQKRLKGLSVQPVHLLDLRSAFLT
jgi:peptide/nickel transport system substrate-binding protein